MCVITLIFFIIFTSCNNARFRGQPTSAAPHCPRIPRAGGGRQAGGMTIYNKKWKDVFSMRHVADNCRLCYRTYCFFAQLKISEEHSWLQIVLIRLLLSLIYELIAF